MSGKLGKIDKDLVSGIIGSHTGATRSEVKTGPGFGIDVSVISLPGGMAMALTSDPLSLIPSLGLMESAWLSVHLMANDMATTGFAPMYGQFVLNLPAEFSKSDFETYWQHIARFCKEIGVSITGGHTGFIEGQHSTIAGGGTFITVAPESDILTSTHARPGDSILVTKQCALSSAAILAMSFPETVTRELGTETCRLASEFFYQTSSLPDALTAGGTGIERQDITAMHDVTEGGVLGAIYELTIASGNGGIVHNEKLPVGEVPAAVCQLFGIDPRYSIGAGAMIITCRKGAESRVCARLEKAGIPCSKVGEIRPPEEGIKLVRGDRAQDLEYQEEDPYWAAFFNAIKRGWK